MPLFLSRELGMTDLGAVALWTGTISLALGLSQFVASPLWGAVADRHGRKLMLIRALAGTGLFTAALALSQHAWHAVAFRFGFGAVTGIVPIASAMIVAQAPRADVGWALGMLASAFAIGHAFGPLAAGLAATVIGLRALFLIGGGVLLLATLLVAVAIKETKRVARNDTTGVWRQLRALDRNTRVGIFVLLLVQCFLIMSTQASNPMVAVKLLDLAKEGAPAATGLAFTLFGGATAVAAVSFSRPIGPFGYRGVVYIAMCLLMLCFFVLATTSSTSVLVGTMGVLGFASGSLQPSIRSILGLSTPTALAGTMFGLYSSATALGIGVGPFFAGAASAALGVSWGIAFAVVPLTIAAITFYNVREPTI
jgi:DHA1 family multidrug resistance protein-like MFS transporter